MSNLFVKTFLEKGDIVFLIDFYDGPHLKSSNSNMSLRFIKQVYYLK